MAFVTAGQTDSAEMHAKKAVLLEPDCDNYLNTLAGIYMLKGNPRAAIPLLEKAGIVNPGNLRYPYNTGLYFMHNNEHDSAIYYFRKVLIIDPTYTEAIKNIAGELTAAGKKDSAAKYEGMMHK